MTTSSTEQRVVDEIERRSAELIDLLATLVAFDTQAPGRDLAPREEAALQSHLAERLRAAGLDVEVWEPDVAGLPPTRYPFPDGYHFRGRPQLRRPPRRRRRRHGACSSTATSTS